MGSALQVYEGSAPVSLWKKPEEVLSEAQQAAKALMSVMEKKEHKVMFNGERYLEREDWGTVAKFYGCTAKVVETRYVEFGDVRGFEATAVCITADMREIGRCESMCLDDEENWGEVTKYEWQDEIDPQTGKKIWDPKLRNGKGGYKGKRVEVGKVPKPLFQLKSMAQTRAEAKVLKSVFGWVVVLAGYRPGVAEEMTGNEERYEDREEKKTPVQQPTRASEKKQEPTTPTITGRIESIKMDQKGRAWLSLDKKIVVLEEKFVDDEVKVDNVFTVKAVKHNRQDIGDYYVATEVLENPKQEPPVLEGEVVTQQSGGVEIPEDVGDLFESGKVQKGSEVQTRVIGPKRAQRLYAMMNQNKQTTGLTEAKVHDLMKRMKKPLEHLSNLEIGLHEMFEKLMTGEVPMADVEKIVC